MSAEHRTVSRVIGILEAIARATAPVTLTELSDALDAPKSSVHGLVGGLLSAGYVRLSEDQRGYLLGPGIQAILGPAGSTLPLLLGDVCREIALRSGETVTIAVRVGIDAVAYIHAVPSAYEVCYSPRLNERRPLYPSSAGKIFVAHAGGGDRAAIEERMTAEDLRRFAAEEDAIRRTGMAFNREETVRDVGAVAVGVHDRGQLVACLSIAGPSGRVAGRLEHFGAMAVGVVAAAGFGAPADVGEPTGEGEAPVQA